jgi:rod shape-determining protein MreD
MNQPITLWSNLVWLVLIVVSALLEATWLQAISIQEVVPDIVLILVVYFAITEGAERGMYTGLIGGIFQDVAANTGVGHHVICLVLVGYIVGRMASRLITDNPYVKALTVLFSTIVHEIFYVMIEYVQKVDLEAMYTMSYAIPHRACYTAIVTPIVFYLLLRIRGERYQGVNL